MRNLYHDRYGHIINFMFTARNSHNKRKAKLCLNPSPSELLLLDLG